MLASAPPAPRGWRKRRARTGRATCGTWRRLDGCRLGGCPSKAVAFFLNGASTALGRGISMDFFLRALLNRRRARSDSPCSGAAEVVESGQFLARRLPRGRSGSVLVVYNRLRRMRGRFHRWIQISTGAQHCADLYHDPPKFSIQSSLESTERSRMRSRGPPDPRPVPEGVREPIYIRKK